MRRWALVPLALACGAIAAPGLLSRAPELGFVLQRGFALVCHQQAERSFVLFGGTVAVCARCLGIYLGVAVGLVINVPRHLAWRFLQIIAAMNLADWLAELAGFHGNWMFTRFALGFALGVAGAMLAAASPYPLTACTNSVAPINTRPT